MAAKLFVGSGGSSMLQMQRMLHTRRPLRHHLTAGVVNSLLCMLLAAPVMRLLRRGCRNAYAGCDGDSCGVPTAVAAEKEERKPRKRGRPLFVAIRPAWRLPFLLITFIFTQFRPSNGLSATPHRGSTSTATEMRKLNLRGAYQQTIDLFERWQAATAAGERRQPSVYIEAMAAHSRLGAGRSRSGGAASSGATATAATAAGEHTLAVFQQMQAAGCQPNVHAYTIAMRACATSKLWPVALSLYADMREADGVDPDTVACNAVLVACERGGQLEEAELLLRDMRLSGPPPDVISYNTAIATASRTGAWQRALALLDEMDAAGVPPDVVSFATTISACERGGAASTALAMLQRMDAAGVRPNTVAYNAAIRACATPDLWPAALSLLDDMRQDAVPRTIVTYNAALAACERGGAWEEANHLLEELRAEGLVADAITYHTAIACTRDAGSRLAARLAVRLVRTMLDDGLTPSVIGLTGAMCACNSASEWRAALALYGQLEHNGLSVDAIAIRQGLVAAAGAADWQAALKMVAARDALEQTATVSAASGTAWARNGKAVAKARGKGQVPGGREPPTRSSDYALAARACRAAGQAAHAARLEGLSQRHSRHFRQP